MKFKSKLSLIGLAILISGMKAQAMDDQFEDSSPQRVIYVNIKVPGKQSTVPYNGTYEGLIQAYEAAFGEDANDWKFLYNGALINSQASLLKLKSRLGHDLDRTEGIHAIPVRKP